MMREANMNDGNRYSIGQVLYIVTEDYIVPCVVVEEVVKKTLEGTETDYKICLHSVSANSKPAVTNIKNVQGEIYVSMPDAINAMRRSFEAWLSEKILVAEKIEKNLPKKASVEEVSEEGSLRSESVVASSP